MQDGRNLVSLTSKLLPLELNKLLDQISFKQLQLITYGQSVHNVTINLLVHRGNKIAPVLDFEHLRHVYLLIGFLLYHRQIGVNL